MTSNLLDKKLDLWEHRLLDLGKRNKMINYRETKRSTLKLIEPSFDELFRRLALNEETLTFQRSVDRETDIRVYSILSLLENLDAPLPVTIGDIKTEGSMIERQKTLKIMRAKARLALEEQGTNILYLSFGFIEWRDGKGASAQQLRSPLILVPAVLALESIQSPFTLKKHEDDIVVNPTLQYYLKSEYGIDLPNFDEDKESIDEYLHKVEEVADQHGWRIVKEVSLGLLSFLKITMYNDLRANEARIKENHVIRALSGDTEEVNRLPEALENFDLDSISARDCYQVMSADSSQQDAILYSKNNVSFVMQGPPGTGKSQTITNIIAEALAEGKKVLFVSEKMAALQVVYRRLQEAHLGDFCLPLHSYKANKKEILEQIGANLKLKQTVVKDSAIGSLEELSSARSELNRYAAELHRPIEPLNMSCYEVFGKLERLSDAPTIAFSLDHTLELSQADLQAHLNALKAYALSVSRLGNFIKHNPWEGIKVRAPEYDYSETMKSALIDVVGHGEQVKRVLERMDESPALADSLAYERVAELSEFLTKIGSSPDFPKGWRIDFDADAIGLALTEAREAYAKRSRLRGQVAEVFSDGIYDYSVGTWKDALDNVLSELVVRSPLQDSDVDFYIENAEPLRGDFTLLASTLDTVSRSYTAINELLGTAYPPSEAGRSAVGALMALITSNTVIPKEWFLTDRKTVKALLDRATQVAREYDQCKAEILKSWEAEIFKLDYAPILRRYKTDYTGIKKVFNHQYNEDKNQIRALSKTILKKLEDETAIGLLGQLKLCEEKRAWFEQNEASLASAFGDFYKGIDTQWDALDAALTNAESIAALFENGLPYKLIDLLSHDHFEAIAKLDAEISADRTAIEQASKLVIRYGAKLDVGGDADELKRSVQAFLESLKRLSDHWSLLDPYRLQKGEACGTVTQALDCVVEALDTDHAIAEQNERYCTLFGDLYCGESTDWAELDEMRSSLAELRGSTLFDCLLPIFDRKDSRKAELVTLAAELSAMMTDKKTVCDWLSGQFEAAYALGKRSVSAYLQKASDCLEHIELLGPWIDYCEASEVCRQNGLGDFIERIEDAEITADIDRCFLKGFYRMWIGAMSDQSDAIRRFRRNTQDERVRRFAELDDLQLLIAQMRIREKLIADLPSEHRLLRATDEVAILQKELSKKRNIMPLRKLFRLIPNLLMRLKPCLMMSPLSVSYFLETEAYHFDLVIFDEASQIFPEDAIGAIFRGSQVIIAGDSKQLPPTSFFTAATNNSENEYDNDEEEDAVEIISDSILEESASVLPSRTLLWHYRSKHEGLIAFSNREIYQNNLITFPNSTSNLPDMGVEYIYVADGYYEGGGKNFNVREAEECVKLVAEHIERHPDRSLGIIAFSEKQQTAIENAIIDFRERSPQYEWFFDESREEPFFVKNLENVQGDERDTILFSICYAKDRNGKMYMRFGPLGQEGGERRLNVAITRAKCNIKLVGSILPSDIDLGRTESEGVRMLRSYIEFARKGTSALRVVDTAPDFDSADTFCDVISDFIEQNGYRVEKQVGCSDYKIDIAVEDPEQEGEYLVGIECDGHSYIQAKTARDRDHLRRSVLEKMGWRLYRVWSTEWHRNPRAEGEALLAFIRSQVERKASAEPLPMPLRPSEAEVIEEIASEEVLTVPEQDADNPYGFDYYKEADWTETVHSGAQDALTIIGERLLHIIGTEQPIHLELIYKRMAPAFMVGKATEAVKNAIDGVIAHKLTEQVTVDEDRFVRMLPLSPITARIPAKGSTPRPLEYIHTEEVADAMLGIIAHSYGMTEEALTLECARAFGFERKGPKIKSKTDAALAYLVDAGKIKLIDGKAQLIGE